MPKSCGPGPAALVRSHAALDPDIVEPVRWGKKSGPHLREPGRSVLPINDLVVAGDAIVSEHARRVGPPKVARVPLAGGFPGEAGAPQRASSPNKRTKTQL
ncbi:hypothetical protein [Arthrobacter globiformis]|uniref:hypothetical protein n=1 Tax=Arthrobacter globiformis TaxID=1665 RepID=UPI00278883A8|nr:hypothetical protein [Arthrobacter globiformis]MDQ0866782.1 hypothetical protein [Arthrobacter globiformis]